MARPVILVVDDDRATANFLVTALDDAGYGARAAAIPLVLMTADAHDRGGAGTVDGRLAKPFHRATLFATLARWAPLP